MEKIQVEFSYDTTRGVYSARINSGKEFLFGGHRDAPMPAQLANALEALRKATYSAASPALRYALDYETKEDVREELRSKLIEFERKGGRVQTQGVLAPKGTSSLSLDDLGL